MKFRIIVCDPVVFIDGVFEGHFESLAHCMAAAAKRGWHIRGHGAEVLVEDEWVSLEAEMHAALGEAYDLMQLTNS